VLGLYIIFSLSLSPSPSLFFLSPSSSFLIPEHFGAVPKRGKQKFHFSGGVIHPGLFKFQIPNVVIRFRKMETIAG